VRNKNIKKKSRMSGPPPGPACAANLPLPIIASENNSRAAKPSATQLHSVATAA
jgi:hypothetical protein